MVDFAEQVRDGVRRETASLLVNALLVRLADSMSGGAADHPRLKPTVFIPTRRGETVTWEDLVARKV